MIDIIFICWKCSKSLAVSAEGAGLAVTCPDCTTHLTIPSPSFSFTCGSCGAPFCSSDEYSGISVYCPTCDSEITISGSGNYEPLQPAEPEEGETAHNPLIMNCPACENIMAIELDKCPHCGAPNIAASEQDAAS